METHIERTLVHYGRAGRQSGHQAEGQGAGQMVDSFPADRAAGPSGCFRVLRSLVSPMGWLDVKGLQSLIKISASFSRCLHL